MRTPKLIAARLAIVFALMLAMVGTGFAHQFSTSNLDDDLSTYLAAGGSYADLCIDREGGHAAGATCDACRLVDTASVPVGRAVQSDCEFAVSFISATPPAFPYTFAIQDPAHPTRAPPIV